MKDKGAETKAMVIAIHKLVPDDPVDAAAVLAIAFAMCVIGAGFDQQSIDDAMAIELHQARDAARQQGLN